jgi:Na+/H+ antiporter NhaD/arsenite permease-like protein
MLFAGAAGFSFNDFFVYQGKPSVFFFVQLGAIAGGLFSFWIFRSHSHKEPVARDSVVVSWVPLLLLVGMVAGLAWNSLHEIGVGARSGLICLLAALLGQIWFVLFRKEKLREAVRIVRELDWDTLFFLVGIFIMLGALNHSGAIGVLADAMASLFGTNILAIYVFLVAISVLISGFVDNVPYIALMLPLISRISGSLGTEPTVLYFGLLVGACLGGNVTPFGASANIVATGLAKKNGDPVSFGRFVKIGAPFTLITTTIVATAVWLFWGP